ncbi:MAG TPA: flagellar assembly protein A [Rhodocyclaceae bacterium]|nr:flagellar assembly protein A [Rhodocyclaceae bacterium]
MTEPQGDGNSVGNMANLNDGQVLLPRFVLSRPDGLYVDLSMLDAGTEFQQFAGRVFESGSIFLGLDYPVFLKLLYEPESEELLKSAAGTQEQPEVRFAKSIAPFAAWRRPIYRDIRIDEDGSRAEYIFEPVMVDITEQIPICGPLGPDGRASITGYETRTSSVRARPDPDEFVAAMWAKGIRFGLDIPEICRAAASDKSERLDVARSQPATMGRNASIVEETDALHRDDTPSLMPNGRMNLSHFRNRFPQVTEGTRLVKKTSRELGHQGWDVRGNLLQPELPQDFDINTLAGPGTRIERTAEGEFVVAAMNGFLNIDADSSTFSITEKIINKTGVSMRTTGDLTLTGAEFEEHGEVQEKREVQGMHMSFMSDVFGTILSAGGNVLLKSNLAGGSIRNPGGNNVVEGKVSRATIEARGGTVQLEFAEGSLIIANQVKITRAINCVVLAEHAEIVQCEGSAIAARQIRVETCTVYRGQESVLTVLVPDTDWWDKELSGLSQERFALETRRNELTAQRLVISEHAPVAKYLTIQSKLKSGEIKLSSEQEAAVKGLASQIAPALRHLAQLSSAINETLQKWQKVQEQWDQKHAEMAEAFAACTCNVTQVQGETKVRRLPVSNQGFPLGGMQQKELRLRLREHGETKDAVYSGSEGTLSWQMGTSDESPGEDLPVSPV